MRVLLTGGGGFIGGWLQRGLRAAGHDVAAPETSLFDVPALRGVLADPWDAVIHLAAISTVAAAAADPETAWRTNVGATGLLADLVAERCPGAHFVYPSTAHVYAPATGAELDEGFVIDEDRRIGPVHVYGRTKWQGELVARDAVRRGLRVTVLRLFNHTHVSQAPTAFLPYVHAELRQGRTEIAVGNLEVERDFGSMHDLVRAFDAALGAPEGTYNVCSGVALSLGDLVHGLAGRLGVSATFVTEPSRVRAGEARRVVGSWQRLHAATGWRPTVTGQESLLNAFLAPETA